MMLFDEITSALDPSAREILFAREVAGRIVFMDEGQILEESPPSGLLTNQPTPALNPSFP